MRRPIESVMYNDNVDTSTLSDGRDTISQSELTGLTECDVSICDASVRMILFVMRNGLFPNIWLYQGWLLIMLTGQLETGTITVDVVRGPEVKMTLPAMKNYSQINRPFTKLTTAGAGIKNDSLSVDYVKCGEIPVIKLIPVGVLDTEEN